MRFLFHNPSKILPIYSGFILHFPLSRSGTISHFTLGQNYSFFLNKTYPRGDLQDGGGVRRGDHLPHHKDIKNTSTRGTTSTEHLLNAGRRPQISKKARKSPHTWVGQKKKGDKRVGMGGSWEGERFPHTRKPLHWQGRCGEELRSHRGECSTGVQRAKRRDSRTEDWCRPALTSLRRLSAHVLGRVGAGS